MIHHAGAISNEVRRHIRARQATADLRTAADVVSDALVNSGINVQDMSLEQWKAIIFDAFQAARDNAQSHCADYALATGM